MKIPISWLREYVDFPPPVEEVARRITVAGLEVKRVERTGEGWGRVYVGLVERVQRHPYADKLVLATVGYGPGELTVVTGAPNIVEGQKVALALEGAVLWDAYSETPRKQKLKSSKIRGVRSEGMVCSERELGLSEEHEGILVLDANAPVGAPLSEYLGESVLDLELTPNFAYANSVIGLAREVAVITGGALQRPRAFRLPEGAPSVHVEVEGTHLASRYLLQRLDNLHIKPASDYIQKRLRDSGMRPINNVVDVTNYVMLEYGQPLHGFDTSTVEGAVIVRAAYPGEMFETLDHQKRLMPLGTIMIADSEKAIGIGGIMGGLDSEVTDTTSSILLESATFNPAQIRRSSRAMGLRSEASSRFERNLDPELAAEALARAVELLKDEAGAEPVGGPYDWYPEEQVPTLIRLQTSEVQRLLGVDVSAEEVTRILRALDFEVVSEAEAVVVTPPSYRRDVTLPADLVEEVGRIHGYDSIPAVMLGGELPVQRTDEAALLERRAREWLAAAGAQEVINYDLTSMRALDPIRLLPVTEAGGPQLWRRQEDLVKVLNPLSSDREVLRPSLLPGLLVNLRENLRHQERVWLYELDRVFVSQGAQLPQEPKRLAMAIAGRRRPESPHLNEGQSSLFDLKGLVGGLLGSLNVRNGKLTASPVPGVVGVEIDGRCAGFVFEVLPEVLSKVDIDERVFATELDWDTILRSASRTRKFVPYSRFPAVRQDIAVAVAEETTAESVEQVIQRYGGKYLRDYHPVEIYRGAPLEAGTKSLLYRLSFQADDRTLVEDEASKFRQSIERALQQQLAGRVRGSDSRSSGGQ